MRVNMDSSIATDPRVEEIAEQLDITIPAVLGSLFLVWLACYNRRTPRLPDEQIDRAAKTPGFAKALVRTKLATRARTKTKQILIHGVKERIKFLEAQSAKGAKGGKKSGESRRKREANALANASANGSGPAQAYTPDLTPDQAPDLSQDPRAGARVNGRPKTVFDREANKAAAAIAWTEVTGAIAKGQALDSETLGDELAVEVVRRMGTTRLRDSKSNFRAADRKEFVELYAALGES